MIFHVISFSYSSCLDRTKIIQCDATYVDLGDIAESVRPNKMSKNVIASGIDFINKHVQIFPDKMIMHYSVTCKIWDGDFHHKIPRKHFAAHGDFKLTVKKYVSVSSRCTYFSMLCFVSSYT